ncbi:hypothetical protein TSUD_346290 [Trifolium subterraneum]|nr:hypothetical protein TSUD_346290 [Trifolium subterraneum]
MEISASGNWNWQLLQAWIPEFLLNKIAAIPLPCDRNGRDESVSVCSNNNNGFSVAVMYEQICGIEKKNADPIWIKVWKLNVPERASDMIGGKESILTDIGWKPGSFVRLNTDGASKKQNSAGCGGIIRGNQGEWVVLLKVSVIVVRL